MALLPCPIDGRFKKLIVDGLQVFSLRPSVVLIDATQDAVVQMGVNGRISTIKRREAFLRAMGVRVRAKTVGASGFGVTWLFLPSSIIQVQVQCHAKKMGFLRAWMAQDGHGSSVSIASIV